MKRLSRIILVNWYLFEAVEWNIEGHAALVGKNGSGKSSLIDALQLVLLGGHRSDWRPNAKADRQRTRDVRSYVLGLIKEEAAVADSVLYQPRPDALCRICLVFTDEQTGESISVGAAISARKSDPQADFEGFFIAEGCALRLRDFLDVEGEGEVPKPYPALRQLLRDRSASGKLYMFAHQPGDFVRQLLASLGAAKRPPAVDKFRRAFKQSIYLSGLEGTVSDFVRTSILDSKPINLEQMRESIASYRNKQAAVARTNDQIAKLEDIHAILTQARNRGRLRAGYLWCAAELRFQAAEAQREALVEKLEALARRFSEQRKTKRKLSAEIQRIGADLREVQRTLSNDNAQSQKDLLSERLNQARSASSRIEDTLSQARDRLGHAAEVLRYSDELDPQVIGALNEVGRVSVDVCGVWPEDARAVDDAVEQVRTLMPNALKEAKDARDRTHVEIQRIREAMAETQNRIERLEKGRSDLGPSTNALIDVLAEAGIKAVPVCELVEVADPEWQPAIEAYLRGNTEALIVPPEQAERATEIYRRLKKRVYGAIVVNTRKVEQYRDSHEPGTAAALIEGQDPLAVAYVQRLLRGIRLRDDETGKLMREDRALSKDGMYVRQAGIQRLRLPDVPILGRGAREARLKHLNEQAERLVRELAALNEPYRRHEALVDALTRLMHKLEDYPSIGDLVRSLTQSRRSEQALAAQIEAIDTSHLDEPKKREAALEHALEDAQNSRGRCERDLGAICSEFRESNAKRHRLERQLSQLDERRHACEQDEDFDAVRSNELFAELEQGLVNGTAEEYDDLVRKAEERAKDNEGRQNQAHLEAEGKLSQYHMLYPSAHLAEPTSRAGLRAEVELALRELKEIGLHERKKELDDALRRVHRVLRTDLAIKLRSAIDDMTRRFEELNAELRRRPFSSNQIYQFRYDRKSEYAEFLRFIDHVDEHAAADIDGLFDQHSEIGERIEEMLSEGGDDKLADYREYFTYDIEIRDEEAGIRERLSKRMGAASGGEHKTPFYVAMGASLASAYRIESRKEGGMDGGMSLYLADEAFEKMDSLNTVQAANYLKSIGLQLFIAAPDDAEARLRQIVDTVLFFIRDGDKAYVEVDYVTPKARALLGEVHAPEPVPGLKTSELVDA